jgi:hypothetical protein
MKGFLDAPAAPAQPSSLSRTTVGLAAETRRFVRQVQRSPEVRADKVRRMRRLIARGKFLTSERIDQTARLVLEDLEP